MIEMNLVADMQMRNSPRRDQTVGARMRQTIQRMGQNKAQAARRVMGKRVRIIGAGLQSREAEGRDRIVICKSQAYGTPSMQFLDEQGKGGRAISRGFEMKLTATRW